MHDNAENADEPSLVSNNTMEIVVALLFQAASVLVIVDSVRLGFGWKPAEGPAAGYFPFYVGLVMCISSFIILFQAVTRSKGFRESFVSTPAAGRVLAVLVPTALFVACIHVLGIFVASAIFIIGFMLYFGRESVLRSALVGVAVPLTLYFMFERWFLVPLPKGPLEAALGLG